MSRSGVVKPGTSALVESTMNRSTPSSPSRANPRRSVIRPSSGSWSILKSPVCSTRPALVRTATAKASGIEWLTARNSRSKWPNVTRSESSTRRVTVPLIRCSRIFSCSSARVSLEPTSGMSGRCRSRYGTAPMWSSCPWVSTTAWMSSIRSAMTSKLGRMRSTPGWLSSGNSTPQSMISSWPSYSSTAMLRPMSPRPPSGMTRSTPPARGGGVRRFPAADTAVRLPSAAHNRSRASRRWARTRDRPDMKEVRGYLLGGSGNHGLLY